MENIMNAVTDAFENSDDFFCDPKMKENVKILSEYMSSGYWLSDYEKHERGELPKRLKCGVLSQDTLYDLLCDIEERKRKMDRLI